MNAGDPFPDRLALRGLRYMARHGVNPDEKERDQPFEVDVVIHADLADAAERDEVSATVDYAEIQAIVTRVVTGPSHDLIEALAGTIAREVLDATDPGLVGEVEVRVRKPKAPLSGAFETVEATVVRSR
jgi:dihydroneopterin aldolase